MVYADPPFNTGRTQARTTLATVAAETGDRTGFGGRRYATTLLRESSYGDSFDDYLAFLEPRLIEISASCRPRARCTCTWTTARRTTRSCCSTSCSAASAS